MTAVPPFFETECRRLSGVRYFSGESRRFAFSRQGVIV